MALFAFARIRVRLMDSFHPPLAPPSHDQNAYTNRPSHGRLDIVTSSVRFASPKSVEPDDSLRIEHEIGGLDVAMDHAARGRRPALRRLAIPDMVFAANREDGHNVGVMEAGNGFGFALKAAEGLDIRSGAEAQDLQGDPLAPSLTRRASRLTQCRDLPQEPAGYLSRLTSAELFSSIALDPMRIRTWLDRMYNS